MFCKAQHNVTFQLLITGSCSQQSRPRRTPSRFLYICAAEIHRNDVSLSDCSSKTERCGQGLGVFLSNFYQRLRVTEQLEVTGESARPNLADEWPDLWHKKSPSTKICRLGDRRASLGCMCFSLGLIRISPPAGNKSVYLRIVFFVCLVFCSRQFYLKPWGNLSSATIVVAATNSRTRWRTTWSAATATWRVWAARLLPSPRRQRRVTNAPGAQQDLLLYCCCRQHFDGSFFLQVRNIWTEWRTPMRSLSWWIDWRWASPNARGQPHRSF